MQNASLLAGSAGAPGCMAAHLVLSAAAGLSNKPALCLAQRLFDPTCASAHRVWLPIHVHRCRLGSGIRAAGHVPAGSAGSGAAAGLLGTAPKHPGRPSTLPGRGSQERHYCREAAAHGLDGGWTPAGLLLAAEQCDRRGRPLSMQLTMAINSVCTAVLACVDLQHRLVQ